MPRTLIEAPEQHNRFERNLGSNMFQSQDHQDNMSRKGNPAPRIFQTAPGSSHQPWEVNSGLNINQDLEAGSFKDVDMRNPHQYRSKNSFENPCKNNLSYYNSLEG